MEEVSKMGQWCPEDWAAFAVDLCHLKSSIEKEPEYISVIVDYLVDMGRAVYAVGNIPLRVYMADLAQSLAELGCARLQSLAGDLVWHASRIDDSDDDDSDYEPDPDALEDWGPPGEDWDNNPEGADELDWSDNPPDDD